MHAGVGKGEMENENVQPRKLFPCATLSLPPLVGYKNKLISTAFSAALLTLHKGPLANFELDDLNELA